jgi:hypothetical protein
MQGTLGWVLRIQAWGRVLIIMMVTLDYQLDWLERYLGD